MTQFDAEPVPDDHPAAGRLSELFGDHTFFVDAAGLHIVESTSPRQSKVNAATVVKIASWEDASRTRLLPHDPELTDIEIELAPDEAGSGSMN
jgi:hypothetical protein